MNNNAEDYNIEYHTWFNSIGGWALTVQLTGPLPSYFDGYINNHYKTLSIACPINQIESIVEASTPYYFKKWRDLNKAIEYIELNKDHLITTILEELNHDNYSY